MSETKTRTTKKPAAAPHFTVAQLASSVKQLGTWAIGVDLGAQNMRGAWVNSKGELYDPIKWETKVGEGKEKVLNRLVQLVEELLKNPPEGCNPKTDLVGVGFGIPGILHLKKGLVIQSPHFPDWKRFAVHEKLKKKIRFPIFMDNDANVAAIGERVFGNCQEFDHFVYVTLGSGIGGALFLNGDIYHGSLGMAGEIGHITVNPQGLPESTGNRGSVELYASASGIAQILKDLRDKNPGFTAESVEDLYELYKRGDKVPEHKLVQQVFDDMADALGVMLANVVNTLDPQAICFAGGLTHAWKAYSRRMIQITMERSYVARHNKLRILSTSLMENTNFIEAGVVGAACLPLLNHAKEKMLQQPTETDASAELKSAVNA